MSNNELAMTVLLPAEINTFEYTRNHHFIRLARKDGKELKLVPESQLLYYCHACKFEMLTGSNHGNIKCPLCGTLMQSKWGRAQVCFIPEGETDFEFPK